MTEVQARELCHRLIHADSEDDVIRHLTDAGFWYDEVSWRDYGDNENNYSVIGNQQSRPDAAIVEKLINSIDHSLINKCRLAKIDPESTAAPCSIREAVAMFYEGRTLNESSSAGMLSYWSDAQRTEVARHHTITATGFMPSEGRFCISIADTGEGQTPETVPVTFVSLVKSNKLRMPFVQGKFNMGGTGVLKFCGHHNLQLIVTRRNPELLENPPSNPDDVKWGFTIVRRFDPSGSVRSSTYRYLAPLRASDYPGRGGILRFTADELQFLPDGQEPYARAAVHGTLIKLYEYDTPGFRSNVVSSGMGLLRRLDFLMPTPALPIRVHECRTAYRGHSGSFETNVTGICLRLEEDRGENLEDGFPVSVPMRVAGDEFMVTVYAFKTGRARTYRRSEGVFFTINGQTHAILPADFFKRRAVGLSYLADSLLATVDCTNVSGRTREDLFQNSRDRLSAGEVRARIIEQLEVEMRHHPALRELKERRRREQLEAALADDRPLAEALRDVLLHNPTLAKLFLPGTRLHNPLRPKGKGEGGKHQPRRFPTYFRHQKLHESQVFERDCHINMRARLQFETDAENNYFSRAVDPGRVDLTLETDSGPEIPTDFALNLHNGIANLNVTLPANAQVGDILDYELSVTDRTRELPFINQFRLKVGKAIEATTGGRGGRRRSGTGGGEESSGIALPTIVEVREADWTAHSFNRHTALVIKDIGDSGEENDHSAGYDFYINVDNEHLRQELISPRVEGVILKKRFVYGMTLIGLAMIHDDKQREAQRKSEQADEISEEEDPPVSDRVQSFTTAIASILLPLIDSLGSLAPESNEEISVGAADAVVAVETQ